MRRLIAEWFGRGRRIEARLARMETKMAENETTNSTILAKLDALKTQVDEYTTNKGKELAEAVAAARAAQKSDDVAANKIEMDAALAKIDEIGHGLVTFSPSGN